MRLCRDCKKLFLRRLCLDYKTIVFEATLSRLRKQLFLRRLYRDYKTIVFEDDFVSITILHHCFWGDFVGLQNHCDFSTKQLFLRRLCLDYKTIVFEATLSRLRNHCFWGDFIAITKQLFLRRLCRDCKTIVFESNLLHCFSGYFIALLNHFIFSFWGDFVIVFEATLSRKQLFLSRVCRDCKTILFEATLSRLRNHCFWGDFFAITKQLFLSRLIAIAKQLFFRLSLLLNNCFSFYRDWNVFDFVSITIVSEPLFLRRLCRDCETIVFEATLSRFFKTIVFETTLSRLQNHCFWGDFIAIAKPLFFEVTLSLYC